MKLVRSLSLALLASVAAGEASAQMFGPPGRPLALQLAPGFPGAVPPQPMGPPPPVWPAAQMAFAEEAMAAQAPVAEASGCTTCGDIGCGVCRSKCARHRVGGFGEFLFLRARDAEVVFAVPVTGPLTGPESGLPVGAAGVVDPDYDAGYRVGLNLTWDDLTSAVVTYTSYESSTSHDIDTLDALIPASSNVIRPTLLHPTTVTAGAASQFLAAETDYSVDFDLVDLDLRRVWWSDCHGAVNAVIGVRYGHLEQSLDAVYQSTGTARVLTDIDFDGVGVKLGLDGERHHATGLLAYGRGNVSFLAGEFDATYVQTGVVGDIATDWTAGRVVTMLDLELGVGWQTPDGRLRVTGGYLFMGWFNTVQTDEFIDAVHGNQATNLGGSGMSFDGLTTRLELRY